jgi:uncharacterized membrane protein
MVMVMMMMVMVMVMVMVIVMFFQWLLSRLHTWPAAKSQPNGERSGARACGLAASGGLCGTVEA